MTERNYSKFFPSPHMTFAEQLNTLMRFAIYFSVIVFALRKDTNIFFIVVFMAGFTYMLYTVDTQNKKREKFYLRDKGLKQDTVSKKLCSQPSKNNPFMNVLVSDYAENPERKEACDISRGKAKRMAKKYFAQNLYRDVSDIYDKNASDRNYYTTPITTIPNDQNAFAQYLYGQGKTCKEGNGNMCYVNTYRTINT
jgi:hypothetical protein